MVVLLFVVVVFGVNDELEIDLVELEVWSIDIELLLLKNLSVHNVRSQHILVFCAVFW